MKTFVSRTAVLHLPVRSSTRAQNIPKGNTKRGRILPFS